MSSALRDDPVVIAARNRYLGTSNVLRGGAGDIGGVNYNTSPRSSGSPSGRTVKEQGGGRSNDYRLPDAAETTNRINQRTEEAEGILAGRTGDPLANVTWMTAQLREAFIEGYVQTGTVPGAVNEMRNGEGRREYDRVFNGNRREDGTLRYDENNYMSVVNTFRASLAERGLEPDLFQSQYGALIGGDVSPQEFESRVSAVEEGIVEAIPEIQRAFSEAWGVAATPEAAFAVILDPSIGDAVLNREIGVAQIRGQASRFGFARGLDRGRRLEQEGVTGDQARDFFSQAGRSVRSLDRAARRFGDADTDVDVGELEDASLLADPFQRERLRRLQRQQASEFGGSSAAGRGNTLSGLREF